MNRVSGNIRKRASLCPLSLPPSLSPSPSARKLALLLGSDPASWEGDASVVGRCFLKSGFGDEIGTGSPPLGHGLGGGAGQLVWSP